MLSSVVLSIAALCIVPGAYAYAGPGMVRHQSVSPPPPTTHRIHAEYYRFRTATGRYLCVEPIRGYGNADIDGSTWGTYLLPQDQVPDVACAFFFSSAQDKDRHGNTHHLHTPTMAMDLEGYLDEAWGVAVRPGGRVGAGSVSPEEFGRPSTLFSAPPPTAHIGGETPFQLRILDMNSPVFPGACLGANPYSLMDTDPNARVLAGKGAIIPLPCSDPASRLMAVRIGDPTVSVAPKSGSHRLPTLFRLLDHLTGRSRS